MLKREAQNGKKIKWFLLVNRASSLSVLLASFINTRSNYTIFVFKYSIHVIYTCGMPLCVLTPIQRRSCITSEEIVVVCTLSLNAVVCVRDEWSVFAVFFRSKRKQEAAVNTKKSKQQFDVNAVNHWDLLNVYGNA